MNLDLTNLHWFLGDCFYNYYNFYSFWILQIFINKIEIGNFLSMLQIFIHKIEIFLWSIFWSRNVPNISSTIFNSHETDHKYSNNVNFSCECDRCKHPASIRIISPKNSPVRYVIYTDVFNPRLSMSLQIWTTTLGLTFYKASS